MNLGFSPEQLALRDSVRDLLTAHATPAALRELWGTSTGRSPQLWKLLTDVGVPAILVPEAFGGAGGDELDLMLVLEQIGRAAVPDAVLESCMLAPYLIATSASPATRERWLPRIAAGSARISVAACRTEWPRICMSATPSWWRGTAPWCSSRRRTSTPSHCGRWILPPAVRGAPARRRR